ncbi:MULTISPECIES: NAD-dependent epimerase/dehydratase family protein [unclassified Paenibacillus]|uniref:NAD-dependent epimerase/dehydratase family protein n=1 Tax=unclassified Paenibacillus TaxID=185978 RepID=UPI001AE1A4A7|nr:MULTISPECIES: NAD-dependent epimerase/dehydratase family protein [unclassified Paenibacillus]MBP1156510.1 UDP-glucose 4-epimerase [Paenibacillus sp. PvP091]MBP1168104.1 UDP-glucose 4-epimerase [Paenibacillus sp. PvR098]MBP2439132.1 UDP-glucose 4-epimerase [Paenibacillus sp. PvP052]
MNVMVTGGAGFIGSHIVDALIESGHKVHVIDNMTTGNHEFVNPKAVLHPVDITGDRLGAVFEEAKPDIVIHHAAQIDVQTSINQPLFDAKVNILGTISILEQCREHGVRKLIYASSAAVYGPPDYLGVDEQHPLRPISFYGISKHTPEHYIEAFAQLSGMDYTILRYANVYGIRQDPKGEGGVVSIFVDRLLQGQQTVIFGDGEQTRDFIYVKDIVSANLAAFERGSRGIYNIGWNQQTSVNELLKLMSELCGKPFAPQYMPQRIGDIIHSRLDNTAAKKQLGWEPRFSLRSGLSETIKYYAGLYKSSTC